MSIEPGRTTGTAQDATALKSLTAALRRLAEGSSLEEALGAIADAAAAATAEESLGRLAAEHAAVALASLGGNGKSAPPLPARDLLRLGGDALATGLDEQRTAEEIARLAAQASGAVGAVVWRFADDLQPYVAGSFGAEGQDGRDVVEAIAARAAFTVTSGSWVLLLGQPPSGALQLRFEQPLVPSDEVLDA